MTDSDKPLQQPFTMRVQLGRTLEDGTLQVLDMLPKLGLPHISLEFWGYLLRVTRQSTVESVQQDLEAQVHSKRCLNLLNAPEAGS